MLNVLKSDFLTQAAKIELLLKNSEITINATLKVGTCFAHQSLDYVAQINIAHARKSHVFLDAVSFFQ